MDTLRRMLERDGHAADVHAYLGYAGWAPGQLAAEIARGDWIVAPADAESVFDTPPCRRVAQPHAAQRRALGARRTRPPGMTPGERYRDELARGVLLPDPAQAALVEELDRVHRSLLARRDAGLLARLARRFGGGSEPVRGLFVWGGVGRGKTHLVDLFYRASGLDPKLRIHFHRFMQHVHGELNALPDREDPLEIVAARIAKRARVLCFDEFHVSDITDAMILGRLLAGLFERGTTLVATSNIEPSRLYADGLQRERFLPAIDLIERHTKVVRLESGADYRLRALGARPNLVHRRSVPMPTGALRNASARCRQRTRSSAGRSRFSAAPCLPCATPKASPGSTSRPCAAAHARSPTTSRSPATSTP